MTAQELLNAFTEYVESTSNQGAVYVPTTPEDVTDTEGAIERAWATIERAEKEGVTA